MTSINLLPEEIRGEIDLSKRNAKLRQSLFLAITVFIGVLTLFAVVIFYLLTLKQGVIKEKEVAQLQIDQKTDQFEQAKDLYTRLNLIKKIKNQSVNWSLVLAEVAKQTPPKLQIESLASSQAEGTRTKITGSAIADKDIVAFKENLERSSMFNYVDLESITNGVDPKGREVKVFAISLSLDKEAVK